MITPINTSTKLTKAVEDEAFEYINLLLGVRCCICQHAQGQTFLLQLGTWLDSLLNQLNVLGLVSREH